jgi:SAM-dependent methyltransferase
VFARIYETDHWKGGSGQGSRPDATLPYRRLVERLLSSSDIRSVVDIGCGDWQSSQLIDWRGVNYIGVDVVPEVTRANTARFGGPNVTFICSEVIEERVPRADLLLCKDVLQHWPNRAVRRFITRQRWLHRYMLLTNDVESVHSPEAMHNADIPMGHWRTIDLAQPPFRVRPAAVFDYPIGTEWRKRALLLVNPSYRWRARSLQQSALALARRYES